jgi:hypothetical protein
MGWNTTAPHRTAPHAVVLIAAGHGDHYTAAGHIFSSFRAFFSLFFPMCLPNENPTGGQGKGNRRRAIKGSQAASPGALFDRALRAYPSR